MRRVYLLFLAFAFPALACNLTASPTPVPTNVPSVLQSPVLGLNPVTGAPGTVVNVAAAGFPAGSKVNLYLSTSDTPNPNPVAQNLTIGTGGTLVFAMQVPAEVNNKNISGTIPLTFTVASADNTIRANAIFIAQAAGTGTVTATAISTSTGTGGTGGTGSTGSTDNSGGLALGRVFITSPDIGSTVAGNTVTVTGSGSSVNNKVGVQVLDSQYNVLGSAVVSIQGNGAGTVGIWQATIAFTQPAALTNGYIVAYTVNGQGGVADQTSIPIVLAGAGVIQPTAAPLVMPTTAPTVPAVITVAPAAGGNSGFITATP